MELQTMRFGIRKLQKVTGGYTINIPLVLVKSFGLKQSDKFDMSATTNGTIIMERVEE